MNIYKSKKPIKEEIRIRELPFLIKLLKFKKWEVYWEHYYEDFIEMEISYANDSWHVVKNATEVLPRRNIYRWYFGDKSNET